MFINKSYDETREKIHRINRCQGILEGCHVICALRKMEMTAFLLFKSIYVIAESQMNSSREIKGGLNR